jgi:ribosomal protein S18 acetylase RimI-like enzyme
MSYTIRPLTDTDKVFLRDMLYQAIFVPEGETPPPRDIVEHPELARYIENWGQPDDMGFAAVDNETEQPVGAAWLRLIHGYGYIDDTTPELSIALLPEHRSKGAGTLLLQQILETAQAHYPAVSLSVSSRNPARFLYQRMGFEIVNREDRTLTMLKRF